MPLDPVVNFFRSNIATLPLNSGTTTLVVASGDGNKLPDPAVDGAFNLVVYNAADPFATPEIVRCTARSSDTLTILRAQEGSSDTTKAAGLTWTVELVPTAKMISDIDTAIQAVTPVEVVNNLTSTDTDKALSAAQGKVLQDTKEPADATILKEADIVDNLTSTSITAPLSANQGKALEDTKVAKSGDTMTGTLTATKLIPSGDVVTGNGMYLPATNTVALSTDGTERLRVIATGELGVGMTPTAGIKVDVTGSVRSSTGILFGTDTASANTLDDYEEGTWTLGIEFGGASAGVTYTQTEGKYTKIGNQVTATGFLVLSSKGSSTGTATITGLPFAVANSNGFSNGGAIGFFNTISFADILQLYAETNSSDIYFSQVSNAGSFANTTDANFANNSRIQFSLTYFTS
jgi:hypothetical protein